MGKWMSIGATLIIVWVLAWLVFKIASIAIHLLLLAGLAFVVISLVRRATHTRTPRHR